MKKWRNSRGITLAETLIAVLIFTVVLTGITTGVTTALNVYKEVRQKADAQTLLSTSIMAISGDLYYVDVNEDGTFIDEKRNLKIQFKNDGQNGIVRVCTYSDDHTAEQNIVTDKTQPLNLYAELKNNTISYNSSSGLFHFTIDVRSKDDPSRVIETQEVSVRSTMHLDEDTQSKG